MMADETKYRRCERPFRNCGIWLVVLVAAALVYLARLEKQSGDKRFLDFAVMMPSPSSDSASLNFQSASVAAPTMPRFGFYLKIPILDTFYRPVLISTANLEGESNKFANFIIGVR